MTQYILVVLECSRGVHRDGQSQGGLACHMPHVPLSVPRYGPRYNGSMGHNCCLQATSRFSGPPMLSTHWSLAGCRFWLSMSGERVWEHCAAVLVAPDLPSGWHFIGLLTCFLFPGRCLYFLAGSTPTTWTTETTGRTPLSKKKQQKSTLSEAFCAEGSLKLAIHLRKVVHVQPCRQLLMLPCWLQGTLCPELFRPLG